MPPGIPGIPNGVQGSAPDAHVVARRVAAILPTSQKILSYANHPILSDIHLLEAHAPNTAERIAADCH